MNGGDVVMMLPVDSLRWNLSAPVMMSYKFLFQALSSTLSDAATMLCCWCLSMNCCIVSALREVDFHNVHS